MTAELLSSLLGIAISLLVAYIPGLGSKWDALESDKKRAIMGAMLVVIAVGVFALGCAGIVTGTGIECTKDGAVKLASILVAALIANQSTYKLLVEGRPHAA